MRLPRDISGAELASRLRQYGYETTWRTGGHLRLSFSAKGHEHHITIPAHQELKVGSLNAIPGDVGAYLEMDRAKLAEALFRR